MFSYLVFLGSIVVVLGCGADIDEVKWVDSSNNIAPDRNFPYIDHASEKYFVCKGEFNGILYGGTYIQSTKKICKIIVNGEVKDLTNFSVLVCAPSSMWIPVIDKLLPNNAFKVGIDTMCRGRATNNQVLIGTLGKTIECDEETTLCTETLVCRGFSKTGDSYNVELASNFRVLTMTTRSVVTEGSIWSQTFNLTKQKPSNIISFNAKATRDLSIVFLNKNGELVFELLVGGLNNSITAIRTWKAPNQYANSTYTPYVADEFNYAGYYIYWDTDNILIGYAIKSPAVIPPSSPLVSLTKAEIEGVTSFKLQSSTQAFWHIFCEC